MATVIDLPTEDGRLERYRLRGAAAYPPPERPFTSRVLYAAAHVVADPSAARGPGEPAALDWDATLRYRHHLWRYGFGVAEAMDTAQRGMGLDHPASRELIRRACAEARSAGGRIACGAGTDQLPDESPRLTLDDIGAAYEEQVAHVEACGGRVIMMASRQLAAVARGAEDYAAVYGRVLRQVSAPVILHWLGPMFDPALAGYWGASGFSAAAATLLGIIAEHPGKVDGVKISLLDAEKEIELRRRLPAGVLMYSGDDFAFPRLIKGDAHGHSDGLLGIFDAIAPAAAAAMAALEAGRPERYDAILAPAERLSRHVFAEPTFDYKVGIVLLAYLNGHQDHVRMLGGMEDRRSPAHLGTVFRLADRAGLLRDPEDAAARMARVLADRGVA